MPHRLKFLVLFAALVLLGAGCIQFQSGGAGATDGGVFKSVNKGAEWTQKIAVPTVGAQKKSIAGMSIATIAMDPQDRGALYAGTTENGLFYSYDGGEGWFQASSINHGRVPSIAVDPKVKCTIYAAFENKVLKSIDCSRSYQTVYFESRVDKQINAVAVDSFNNAIVYAGTSSGDLLKSIDFGASWSPIKRFDNPIKKIVVAPYDTRIVYAATADKGVHKTVDGGANWKDLSKSLEQFQGANQFRDLVLDLSTRETLILATQYGLLRSSDGGTAWQRIELLTPPGAAAIYSLAVNPKSGSEIYYGTATTFYRTENGGFRWITKKLPTTRAATALLVDPVNTGIIYMGVTKFKQ